MWNSELFPAHWTSHAVSRLFVLAVVQQALETERVDTRQNSRVGEYLSADATFRHIIQFLAN